MNFHRQEKAKTDNPIHRNAAHRIIGIMGGTFNPIHEGHVQLAVQAHDQFHLPEILVMPSGNPSSYKDSSDVASAVHRCNMIRLAISGYPFLSLSELEIKRNGPTYTSDTLAVLCEMYDKIYFIIGADSLFALPTWHEAAYVMTHCHLLVANRNQHRISELTDQKLYLESDYHAQIDLLNVPNLPYSSTSIRGRIAAGRSIQNMVAPSVRDYIKKHGLYGDCNE